jgi:hypothetical protein
MTCSILDNDDQNYYKRRLYERAERIGIEATCFVLDLWDIELKKLYDRFKAILRLTRKYHFTAFEAACERANFYNQLSMSTLTLILKYYLNELPLDADTDIWGQKEFDFLKTVKDFPRRNYNNDNKNIDKTND